MGEINLLNLEMAVKRRPEAQRSVPDKSSKMQSMSSLQGAGLTDPTHNSQSFDLFLLQTPKDCRVAGKSDSDKPVRASKWPLDPAPVIEFKLHDGDPARSYLHSPFWFCSAALEHAQHGPETHGQADPASSPLSGGLVSSLHKVKLQDNIGEHGLFIFGDLHAKKTGQFRLRFTLYELRSNADSTYVASLASKLSEPFMIHSAKTWPGQAESTQLSRHLCDSGVKLRIRKETSKRKAQSQDWASDKRAAISSLALPMPMGPPPNNRRRLTGEDISLDQVKFAGGLGIKGAMDREQYTNAQTGLRGGFMSLADYRPQSESYPSMSGSYLTQNNLAYDNRATYNPTPYAGTQYLSGQVGYSSDTTQFSRGTALASSLHSPRTSGIQEQSYPASSGSNFSFGTSRYGSSYSDSASRSDINQHNSTNTFGGVSSMYGSRSGYTEASTRYDDARSDRSMMLPETNGTSNSSMPGWNQVSLSAIDPPRSD